MPNIKSAKKRVLVIDKKTMRNKAIKSALKTQVKKFLDAINAGDKEAATKQQRSFSLKLYPLLMQLLRKALSTRTTLTTEKLNLLRSSAL